MTEAPLPAIPEEAPASKRPHPGLLLAKGCGCLTFCVLLAVGVAFAGNGDIESWGSGICGAVILIWVVGTSGTNGFFLPKK